MAKVQRSKNPKRVRDDEDDVERELNGLAWKYAVISTFASPIGILLVLFVGFVVFWNLKDTFFDATTDHIQEIRKAFPDNRQDEVNQIVQKYKALYKEAEDNKNDFGKSEARTSRGKELCAILPDGSFKGWGGIVKEVRSDSPTSGTLIVETGRDVLVRAKFDDSMPFFKAASSQKNGGKLILSGSFTRSQQDCFLEASLTESGGMREPEFQATVRSLAVLP